VQIVLTCELVVVQTEHLEGGEAVDTPGNLPAQSIVVQLEFLQTRQLQDALGDRP
jgi:hypothetical protein